MPERAGHGERDPDDYYATHPELARLLCRRLRADFPSLEGARSVLEPGCGAGTFLAALQEAWPAAAVVGVELHADLAAYSEARGFTVEHANLLARRWGQNDLIVGNPPFRHAEEVIALGLRALAPGGKLALLLRLNFLAGQARFGSLWSRHAPERIYVLPARPGFTGDGKTDATDYCLVVWGSEPAAVTQTVWLDLRGVRVKWDGRPERPDAAFPDPRRSKESAGDEARTAAALQRWSQ